MRAGGKFMDCFDWKIFWLRFQGIFSGVGVPRSMLTGYCNLGKYGVSHIYQIHSRTCILLFRSSPWNMQILKPKLLYWCSESRVKPTFLGELAWGQGPRPFWFPVIQGRDSSPYHIVIGFIRYTMFSLIPIFSFSFFLSHVHIPLRLFDFTEVLEGG